MDIVNIVRIWMLAKVFSLVFVTKKFSLTLESTAQNQQLCVLYQVRHLIIYLQLTTREQEDG